MPGPHVLFCTEVPIFFSVAVQTKFNEFRRPAVASRTIQPTEMPRAKPFYRKDATDTDR